MRTAPLLFLLALGIVPAGLLGACGSNVMGTGGSGGASNTSTGQMGGSTATSTSDAGGSSGTTVTSGSATMASSSGMVAGSSSGTSSVSSTGGTMASSSGTMATSSVSSSSGTMATSSVSSSSGAPDGGPTCPSLGDPCTECLSTSCASTYCSCYGNLACDQLDQCVGACATGNQTCLQTCLTAHKDGISAAYLLSNCADETCVPACPSNGTTLDACQVCLFSQCVPEMNNCIADPECLPLIACWNGCNGSTTCIDQCNTTYPAGVTDGQAVALCSGSSCQGSCP